MYKVDNYINGEGCSVSNESSKIINPSYGTQIGEVLYANNESANSAVDAAYEASKLWAKTGLPVFRVMTKTSGFTDYGQKSDYPFFG